MNDVYILNYFFKDMNKSESSVKHVLKLVSFELRCNSKKIANLYVKEKNIVRLFVFNLMYSVYISCYLNTCICASEKCYY